MLTCVVQWLSCSAERNNLIFQLLIQSIDIQICSFKPIKYFTVSFKDLIFRWWQLAVIRPSRVTNILWIYSLRTFCSWPCHVSRKQNLHTHYVCTSTLTISITYPCPMWHPFLLSPFPLLPVLSATPVTLVPSSSLPLDIWSTLRSPSQPLPPLLPVPADRPMCTQII